MYVLQKLNCFVLIAIVISMAGCGGTASDVSSGKAGDADLMADLLGDIDLTDGRAEEGSVTKTVAENPPRQHAQTPSQQGLEILPASSQTSHQTAQRFESRHPLRLGGSFSIVKTTSQQLRHQSGVATTSLEVHSRLEVRDQRPDASLLRVTFLRVRYHQDINGEVTAFDSANHLGTVPDALQIYAGMVNNGFSFWLGNNNSINEVIGFDGFLKSCLARAPTSRQATLSSHFGSMRGGAAEVRRFVDESIGLMPLDRQNGPPSLGDIWTREESVSLGVPVKIKTTCQVSESNGQTASINLTGQISPVNDPYTPAPPVAITDGRTMGTCVVDQSTGLPISSRRSTVLNLAVSAVGRQVETQEKRIEITVHATPLHYGPVVSTDVTPAVVPAMNGRLRPAAGQMEQHRRHQVSQIPTTTDIPIGSTATARYPDEQ